MKVLFVATVVKTHIMEFHVPYLRMFKEMGWETAVAAKNDYEDPKDCIIPYCDAYYDVPFERNPLQLENIKAYKKLKQIFDKDKFDIIHCHTPVGAMLTRLAAKKVRKSGTKVIYTAHGFHFYKGAPVINWLLYYPIEKWLARYTDILITINKEDYNRAKLKFKTKKVEYVPGVGIDSSKFGVFHTDRENKRTELGLSDRDFVLLSVGELIPRKNHEVVIRALAELKYKEKIDGIKYIICGRGKLENSLKMLSTELGIESIVRFLGYRNDVADICNCSDLFIFMSFQEGLPVAMMEAMACGIPIICSNIRGNIDLIENGVSGIYAKNNPSDLADKIIELKNNEKYRLLLAENSLRIIKQFDLEHVKQMMYEIYNSVC